MSKSKKKKENLNLLVLGGSQGIGATTYNYLVSSGHVVFTAQDKPPIVALDDSYNRGFFYYINYLEPSTSVGLVQKFVEGDIKLDGLLWCDEYNEPQPKFLWNAFDYKDSFMQNVIGVAQLLIYLEKHEVLKYAAPALFTTESRKVGSEYLPYGAAKAAMRSYLEFIHVTYPLESELLFIPRPEDTDDVSWDSYTEAVLKTFVSGHSGMGRTVSY
jgi:hypothetical protein